MCNRGVCIRMWALESCVYRDVCVLDRGLLLTNWVAYGIVVQFSVIRRYFSHIKVKIRSRIGTSGDNIDEVIRTHEG